MTNIIPNQEQMARRMDRKVIKLEGHFGSERQFILIKRNQDLIVRDIMEEVEKTFKIPMEEQVIFHKGANLFDSINQKLEVLGIENNNAIRITRDTKLAGRTPRGGPMSNQSMMGMANPNGQGMYPPQQQGGAGGQMPSQGGAGNQQNLDALAYLKEISPQRVPDPTPYQVQVYNMQLQNQSQLKPGNNEVLKLYVSYGSEREYMLINGAKPLMLADLKMQLAAHFKINPEQQCIVFKGYNLHEYSEDAPLNAFGLENNSPIALWPKGHKQPDVRLPRGSTPPPGEQQAGNGQYSPRGMMPPQRWQGMGGNPDAIPSEVMKIDVHHGSDRHQLILKGQNRTLTVADLQQELERVTAVAIKDQRLFYKSSELHLQPHKTLKESELENNKALKLVGEPSKLRYSNYFGKLMPNAAAGQAPMQQQQQQQQMMMQQQPQQGQQPQQQQQQQQQYPPQQQQNYQQNQQY